MFAVNFGPAVVGPALDACGPRLISLAGCALAVLGMVLLGVSHSDGVDAFPAGAAFIGVRLPCNSHHRMAENDLVNSQLVGHKAEALVVNTGSYICQQEVVMPFPVN